jgi:hypothetical protein
MLRTFQCNVLSRGSQRPNLPYKKALRDIFRGIQSTGIFAFNIDIPLTTHSYFTSIYPESVVTTHHQLINQEAIYTASCVAVDFKFNS